MSALVTTTLDSGAVLIVEPVANVASVAIHWLAPVGSATDSPEGDGVAAMLSEMIFRGAGGLGSRAHSDALDRLGIERDSRVTTHHLHVTFTLLGARLDEALPLMTSMLCAPALPQDALEPVRSLTLQTIDGLEDDPQSLVMLRLRERHQSSPFNRHGCGERSVVEGLTLDDLRQAWARRNRPVGSIIGVAGAVDPAALAKRLNALCKGWTGAAAEPVEIAPAQRGCLHVKQESAQVHIGVAWNAPPAPDAQCMTERLGIGVLSGSTSARLFTEVRQKRSLCYSIDASYSAGRDTGIVSLYAGTTPERAQETLDVSMEQLETLKNGADEAEFRRAIVGLKSSLVMSGESTNARAAAVASDYFRLGRARSLQEIASEVDAVSLPQLNEYLATRDFGPPTLAAVGPRPLTPPNEESTSQQVKKSTAAIHARS